MTLPEITEMQNQMYAACGHKVKVHLHNIESPVVGKCINYTKPLDNDPEIASLDIAVPSKFYEDGYRIIEITEDEIETLTLLDKE